MWPRTPEQNRAGVHLHRNGRLHGDDAPTAFCGGLVICAHVNPGFQLLLTQPLLSPPRKNLGILQATSAGGTASYTDFDSNQTDLPSGQHWCRRSAGCPSRVLEGALPHSDTPGLCVRRQ